MTKNQIIKYILEDALGLNFHKNELYVINEAAITKEDPNFEKMVAYYTRYDSPKNTFKSLSEKEQVEAINIVDDVVNGSGKRISHPLSSHLTNQQSCIINMLAAEYIHPNDKVDNWSPDNVDTQNIYEFILSFYNPFKGTKSELSYPAFKAIPKSFDRINFDKDIVLDAFAVSIKDLLFNKNYNPDKSSFDFQLTQMAWPRNILDIVRSKGLRKNINLDPVIPSTGDSEEELDISSQYGQEDTGLSLMSDKDKFQFILNNLDEKDRKVLNGYYNFIFSETPNEELASTKLIDLISDEDGDLTKIDTDDISYQGKQSLYDFVAKEFGLEYNDKTSSNIKILVFRARKALLSLFRDPEFKSKLGIEDWSEKSLDLLKGATPSGKEWKKGEDYYDTTDYEEFEKKSIAYDEFGKPLPTDEKGKVIPKSKRNISEIMMECIQDIRRNFNFRFVKMNNTLNNIQRVNYFINEGYDVAVKDLDQDIYNYLNDTVDGLNKAYYVLRELEVISRDIYFEYPEVAEELSNQVLPLIDELSNITTKVKDVKKHIKPYLQESSKLKKKDLDLEEERITNPDSKDFVKRRENFIGSHIYGEDLGGLGKMYVTYSYGEQFPVYLWYNGKWYHNTNDYKLEDGTVNEPTNQHKEDMRPAQDTHGLSTIALNTMISKFKKKYGLGDNVHTDVEPGEKN